MRSIWGTGLGILVSADRSQVSEGLRTACPGGHGSTSALTALSSEDPEQKALAASRVTRGIPGRFCGIPPGGGFTEVTPGRDVTILRVEHRLDCRVDCEATQMSSVLKSANNGRDRCRRSCRGSRRTRCRARISVRASSAPYYRARSSVATHSITPDGGRCRSGRGGLVASRRRPAGAVFTGVTPPREAPGSAPDPAAVGFVIEIRPRESSKPCASGTARRE